MAKPIESQVDALLLAMRNNSTPIDTRVVRCSDLKASIKHDRVPEQCVGHIFEIIKLLVISPHAKLITAGLSILQALLKRLHLQGNAELTDRHAPRLIPHIVELLGDQKDRQRTQALQCLEDLWTYCPQDVERLIRDNAITSSNPTRKIAGMHWLTSISREPSFQFKTFVPKLVDALEDADGTVRETAKATVVTLFLTAPPRAQADLRKQLQQRNVRSTIIDQINAQLGPPGHAEGSLAASTHSVGRTESLRSVTPSGDRLPMGRSQTTAPSFAASVSSLSQAPPGITPGIDQDLIYIEPLYINTHRELDEATREMLPHFEGRESEGNWIAREKSVTKLRRITKGNAPADFLQAYLACVKALLDGALKAVNSLRTTLSSNGCSLVQEIARAVGPGLDPMVEILLQNLIKLCAGTKKISSQNGNITVNVIFENISYSIRVMQHIWAACQDKNVQPRTYATGWLKTIISKHRNHKTHIEHTGGLDVIEKCLKKGLADANPGVREGMRNTYWIFAPLWPGRAEHIMSTLDTNSKKLLLEKDPNNKSAVVKPQSFAASVGPARGPHLKRGLTAAASHSSLKEVIAARKREAAAQKQDPSASIHSLPPRPGSAMSSFSPPKPLPASSSAAPPGLSSKPMRPPKRPEPMPRPATAGPYSVRKPVRTANPVMTPVAKAPKETVKLVPNEEQSPTAADEELTMVIPNVNFSPRKPSTQHAAPPSETAVYSAASSPVSSQRTPSTTSRHLNESPQRTPRSPTPQWANSPASSSAGSELHRIAEISPVKSNPKDTEAFPPYHRQREFRSVAQSLRVFEDPQAKTDSLARAAVAKVSSVLEELTINEPVYQHLSSVQTMTQKPLTQVFDGKKSDDIRNARLLDSGIARLRAGTLDAHGLRKLQGIMRGGYDGWKEAPRYGELLTALLDFLDSPLDGSKQQVSPSKSQDVKIQVLATVRTMLDDSQEAFTPFFSRAMVAILKARKLYDVRSHIVSALEDTAERLYIFNRPESCIPAVLDLLETDDREAGKGTISMGLHVLGALIERSDKLSGLPRHTVQRLGRMTVQFLNDTDPDVRKSVMGYCLSLYRAVGPATFWEVLGGLKDDQKSLVVYYLAKGK